MKPTVYIVAIILLLSSCAHIQNNNAEPMQQGDVSEYRVEFNFNSPATQGGSNNQELKYGINMYAVQKNAGIYRHLYIEDTRSAVMCLPGGTWDFYVLANLPGDMGDIDAESLDNLILDLPEGSIPPQSRKQPMTGRKKRLITRDTSVEIELAPLTARLQVNVSLSKILLMSSITSVRLMSVPRSAHAFISQPSIQNHRAYTNYPLIEKPLFPAIFNMPENLSGEREDILTEKERDAFHAPDYATYLDVECLIGFKKVQYRIYPGGNTTTDFNLRRGCTYIMDVQINGSNPSDYTMTMKRLIRDDNPKQPQSP